MIYSQLEQDVKWMLCEFRQKSPPLGDSNVEYDYAIKVIELVREQITKGFEVACQRCEEDIWCGKDEKNQDCDCSHHYYADSVRGQK